MPAPAFDSTPAFLLASAIEAVLNKQPQAKNRLVRHAGKHVCLALPVRPLLLRVEADGGLNVASPDAAPDLTLIPDPAALPLWLSGGKLGDLFRVAGDGVLAADIAHALADFDWVLALRPYLGDIAASRADQFIRGFAGWRSQALESAGRNLAEYAVYEKPVLAEPNAVREFVAEVDRLREDAGRLAARLAVLEQRRSA